MTLAETLHRLTAELDAAGPSAPARAAVAPAIDLARLVRILRLERRLTESVVARLHLVRLALEPRSAVDLDLADAGLTDAVDQLREADLLRAVFMTGGHLADAATARSDPGIAVVATAPSAIELRVAAGDLAASVQAARVAIGAAISALDAPLGPGTTRSRRRSALRHLVTHAVPAALAEGF